ncbi:hypothetical protein BCV72DRAFT_198748 [Rhizopus microsporus var. microsporus]|uniref:Phospholipid/glycerol acyltransferase domain-containing protein n=1 Tax=Rhizopus microsporus var. microsporus TaxID=86635 RepID=A0A1X0RFY0_RHIZD|nr:hypothetical protein BCV72DRAFT_198748 [Rhizopus microsporus var. microsporus]
MEKYSKWRDAGTGIQPFLPPVPPRTDSSILITLSKIVCSIAGYSQGILKTLIIFALGLLYILLVFCIGILLTPIRPLKRIWQSLISAVIIRSILFFMGFFQIKTETISVRKSRGSGQIETATVKDGDVIIANWTSYVDVLYLAYKFQPIFTQIYSDSNSIKKISLWQAIRLVQTPPESKPSEDDKVYSLKELASNAKQHGWGPIVIFPEGTTTNGRALLKFHPLLDQVSLDEVTFHLFHNTLHVRILAKRELHGSTSSSTVDSLVTHLGHLFKLRKMNLNMQDKRDFLAFYEARNKKKSA